MAQLETLDLGAWFILRMASSETLKVAAALEKRGFEVWTPVERKRGRKPRTRDHYDKTFPLMPSYVFASVHDMIDLQRLAAIPTADTPRFTIFQHGGGIPLIADDQLDALRAEESRLQAIYAKQLAKGKKGPKFDAGHIVRISEGGFAGLSGQVQEQQGQFTLVNLQGFNQPIKIASILLAEAGEEQQEAA